MANKKSHKRHWVETHHEQIYLRTRGHSVDIHVYPTLQLLWDAGIQTFFSCQGGPDRFCSEGRWVKNDRAMVVVLKRDRKKAMKVLKRLNPSRAKWDNRYSRDRCSIKFDPLPEAQAVQVKVTAK